MSDFMRAWLSVLSGLLALPAYAAGGDRLALETSGPERLGREKIQTALESSLADALGPLIPEGDYAIKKRKLKLRGKKKKTSQLAKAARSAGARWLLLVELSKKESDPPFSAAVRLVDAKNGEVALQFSHRYGRGGATDAGRAVAARIIDHLGPEPEPEAAPEPDPEPEPLAEAPPEEEPEHHPGWVTAEPVIAAGPAVEETRTKGAPPERIEMEPPPEERPGAELGRVRLGAGSGWLRSIQVSGSEVEDSSLSYRLGPTSLFELSGEIVIPGIGLGAALDLGVRPVRYSIDTQSSDSSDPRGTIFDMFAVILYRLEFGSGGVALIPQVGARLSLASVEAHPRDIIPAATTVAVVGGVALRIPMGELVELEAGGHGGYIPLYSERPTDTGRSKGGFTAGGHLALRVWIFQGLGLSFDNRIGFDRLSFEERPTRALPPEEAALENASVGLLELKSTLAVAYRF